MKFIARFILRIVGWQVIITAPNYPKCIVCVAPHTSNWDFILGKLAYLSVGRKAGFLMKESWFFFPLGYFFRAIGGVPVSRKKGSSLVDKLVAKYKTSEKLCIAITPEGTRSKVSQWRTGFLRIAYQADVPILLGVFDFKNKRILVEEEFRASANIDEDMQEIKWFYKDAHACYPEKFTID